MSDQDFYDRQDARFEALRVAKLKRDPNMGDEQLAVCDQCHTRISLDVAERAMAFLYKHRDHNFTGCRVVMALNPVPNRAWNYKDEIITYGDMEAIK